jgi:putative peptidoglycan lipid II flippase
MMQRKILVKKTVQVGFSTLLSKVLGFIRQMLQARFLGAGVIADTFLAAFRLPNSLYKIFIEGSLSAALIPVAIKINNQDGPDHVDKLMTLTLLIIQTFFLVICCVTALYADRVMFLIAPGWADTPLVMDQGAKFLSILMFYIFFFSASSFLAGILQAKQHFFVAAAQPILLNILVIAQLLLCLYYNASATTLALCFVVNGMIILLITLLIYLRFSSFSLAITQETWVHFWYLGRKLLPCFINLGIVEINLFIGTMFASFLTEGSISLLSYSSAFIRLPLSIFATAFATVSLPHLTKISIETPRRLSFHLLECAKMILWVTLPTMLLMSFFSYDIFLTLLVSDRFSSVQAHEAGTILIAFCAGLFFFSLNRILLNMYYAHHETFLPTVISLVGAVSNTLLNFLLMHVLAATGIALATSIAGIIQTILFLWYLNRKLGMTIYLHRFYVFAYRFLVQLTCISLLFYGAYLSMLNGIGFLPISLALFLTAKIGLWLWVGPLCLTMLGMLWMTRSYFGIKIYYFE